MSLIYKIGSPATIVSGYDFEGMNQEQMKTTIVNLSHDYNNSIQVNGLYICPKSNVDYEGDQTPEKDYQDIVYWGTQWQKGLTIIQGSILDLIKNQQGSSRNYMIPLYQNSGIINSAGIIGTQYQIEVRNYDMQSMGFGPFNLTDLIGTARLYKNSQLGIVVIGSDTIVNPMGNKSYKLDILDSNYQVILDSTYLVPIFGILQVVEGASVLTEAELVSSIVIDGITTYLKLSLFAQDPSGNWQTTTTSLPAGCHLSYQYSGLYTNYSSADITLRLEIPKWVPITAKYDFGLEVAYSEIN